MGLSSCRLPVWALVRGRFPGAVGEPDHVVPALRITPPAGMLVHVDCIPQAQVRSVPAALGGASHQERDFVGPVFLQIVHQAYRVP